MKVIFTHMEIKKRKKEEEVPKKRSIVLDSINSIQEILMKKSSTKKTFL